MKKIEPTKGPAQIVARRSGNKHRVYPALTDGLLTADPSDISTRTRARISHAVLAAIAFMLVTNPLYTS